ncbi:fumarylacetoacetate hydrolase family protein [Sphingomonas immobilis]|uniref:Fumarylacetoacetate hydrolase family protein n=1 Tax=Sphingomonas immobilis TaxID=3063997 RepID=A0ABT8ZVK4_9SPHN|nr:fumarylacetoacetate hydrolase family protein [Sphingomonas sp. CA1-15]MDO7840786.1 fumarylacetoacetate hydrolase family protein [Sphingomonas sp. CA1-15]
MKLVTYSSTKGGIPSIGVMVGDGIVDLPEASGHRLPATMLAFLEGGDAFMDMARAAVAAAAPRPLAEIRLHAPLPRPQSIRDTISFEGHMRFFKERTGRPVPDVWFERPIYYKGNPATVIGPDDDIRWPNFSEKLDYELEFGVIIGTRGSDIPIEKALDHVAGYVIFNDMSARETITYETGGNLGPAKGKDFDTGNVMGPWLVTRDEIDPSDLALEARINGEVWSRGRSSDMRWSFAQIISFISQSETLHPGDFIGSGTCEKGCGAELDRWLKPGDVIELAVEGLGVLRNTVTRA